jgi:hypothetical protein
MKLVKVFLVTLIALLVAACGGGGGNDNPLFTGEVVDKKLTIKPLVKTIISGDSLQYQALLSDGTSQQDVTAQVAWVIDDTSIATIDSAGLATAQALGDVIVSAALEGLNASANLEVAAPVISQVLTISPLVNSLNVGTSDQYQAILLSQQGGQVDVTNQAVWSIDQTAIATVSNTGIVAAQSEGEAVITASFNNLIGSANLTVTNKTITSLQVSPAEAISLVGLQTQFFSTVVFDDGSSQDVTRDSSWTSASSTDVSIAVDTGLALALAQTTAPVVISASFGGQSGQGMLEVITANVRELTVDPANAILPVDNLQNYRANLVLDNPDNDVIDVTQQVKWAVANGSIATVSNADFNRGLVQAVSEGNTSVIATLSFAGQTETGSATLAVVPISLVSIAVSPADVTVVRGTTGRFNAVGIYNNQDERLITQSVIWASSASNVVNITASGIDAGNAYAVIPGSSVISASLSGVVGTASATVIAPALSRIDIYPINPTRPLGIAQPFKAVGSFVGGFSQDITQLASWQSSDVSIAKLQPRIAGLVETLAVGQSEISATFNGFTGMTQLTVTAPMPISLKIVPAGAGILPRNSDANYTAFLEYSDNSAVDVTDQVVWASSNDAIATISNGVDDEGRVHSLAGGLTQISANLDSTALGFTGSNTVGLTVTSNFVSFIRASCLPKTLNVGELLTCTCEAVPSGTSDNYDCTSFATYSEQPNEGKLNFSTRPEKNNTAISVSSGPVNVQVKFSSGASNSSVIIE